MSKLTESDIYGALISYAHENERLIYQNTSTYFAIAVPLAGVALGAGDFGADVELFASIAGFAFSLVWFLMIERTRRWFSYILTQTAKMERDAKFENARSTLYKSLPKADWFIRVTPRSSRLYSLVFLSGIFLFGALIVQEWLN